MSLNHSHGMTSVKPLAARGGDCTVDTSTVDAADSATRPTVMK